MPRNKYENQSAVNVSRLANAEYDLFQRKWAEINSSQWNDNEKLNLDAYLTVKQAMFAKYMKSLIDLSDAHFHRKAPGFFARFFTKEGRAYRQERKILNQLAEEVKDLSKDSDLTDMQLGTQPLETGFDFSCLTDRKAYLEKSSEAYYNNQFHKFNVEHNNLIDKVSAMETEKNIFSYWMGKFLREYDRDITKIKDSIIPYEYVDKSTREQSAPESDFFKSDKAPKSIYDDFDKEQEQFNEKEQVVFSEEDNVMEKTSLTSTTAQLDKNLEQPPTAEQFK